MRIRISREYTGHYSAKQGIALCPQAYVSVLDDEVGHVLIAGLVFVLRAVIKQLIEFLKVNFRCRLSVLSNRLMNRTLSETP